MRAQDDKRSDASARSESQSTQQSGQTGERVSSQQTTGSHDMARPLPSAAEPGTSRTAMSGGLSSYRPGFFGSPWDVMRSMSDEVDRFIDSIAGLRGATQSGLTSQRGTRGAFDFGGMTPAAWSPQVEVIQKPNAVVLRADLPGIKGDDVNVSVENGILTLSGERKQEQREERDGFFRSERSYGTFYRAFTLPDSADEDKVAASFKDGVLEINIPLSERERGRRIKVQS